MDTQVVIMKQSNCEFSTKYRWSSGLVLNPDLTNIDICV